MTYRIERFVIEEDHVILCGRIREQDVDTLRACVEQERDAVAIDLKDLLFVDREAVRFLASLESMGTELRNCPAYIREWVTRERAVIHASEQGIIEFYIPKNFRKSLKCVPELQRGKIIEFCPQTKKYRRMVAGRGILRNLGRNNNSPATGYQIGRKGGVPSSLN
jgi:hypothetical protein